MLNSSIKTQNTKLANKIISSLASALTLNFLAENQKIWKSWQKMSAESLKLIRDLIWRDQDERSNAKSKACDCYSNRYL